MECGAGVGTGSLPEPFDVLLAHPDEQHYGVHLALDQVTHAADPGLQQAVFILQAQQPLSAEAPTLPALVGARLY